MDIARVHSDISYAVCVGSPVIIIYYLQQKLANNLSTQKMEVSTRIGTIAHQ